jgi:hypothetical protein
MEDQMRRVAIFLGAVGVMALGLAAIPAPAQAQDNWWDPSGQRHHRHHQWREHAWRHHEWREHHHWRPQYYRQYGYYGYYYAPFPYHAPGWAYYAR